MAYDGYNLFVSTVFWMIKCCHINLYMFCISNGWDVWFQMQKAKLVLYIS